MKRIFTFQIQIVLSLLVGMALSFLSIRAYPIAREAAPSATPSAVSPTILPTTSVPTQSPISSPTTTGTPAPYVTLPGVWMVRIQFSQSEAPQVIKTTYLERGRITPFDRGEYRVELLNEAGDILFSGSFAINFLQGDPPRAVDELTTLLILPAIDQAVRLHLITPQGETTHDLQP